MYKCYTFKQKKQVLTTTSSNITFIYKKLLQNCLVKEFFLVNSFIGVFLRILLQAWQQLPRKAPLIFGTFFIILSICCCHLIVSYLTKPLSNCVSASQIYCFWCCSLSLSVWINMKRTLICRFYRAIFVGEVWKFRLVLRGYTLEPIKVFHIILPL